MQIRDADPSGVNILEAAATEFWLDGELICPCCPIFLKDDNSRCWGVRYDDEYHKWRIDLDGHDYPIVGTKLGDDHMLWREVELTGSESIIGNKIVSFKEFFSKGGREAIVSFANGSALKLSHNFKTERSEYTVLVGE